MQIIVYKDKKRKIQDIDKVSTVGDNSVMQYAMVTHNTKTSDVTFDLVKQKFM